MTKQRKYSVAEIERKETLLKRFENVPFQHSSSYEILVRKRSELEKAKALLNNSEHKI